MTHTTYHIEETGSGEPLLLLHGFTGSCRSWDELAPILAQNYHVICVDLPGHGETAVPQRLHDAELPAIAADLARILRQHTAAPAHVLGYSMGARLALGLALLHPDVVKTLILESGSPGLADETERTARIASDVALAQRLEQHGIASFVVEWERLPLWASQRTMSEEARQRQHAQRMANDPHGLAASLRSMGTGAQPSFWDLLPALQPATLIITGALDTKFCQIAEAMRLHNPHMEHQLIAAAGHAPHLERPDEFAEVVAQFLEAHSRGMIVP